MNDPFRGKTFLITRDQRQSASLVRAIEQRGGQCRLFPTIKITAPLSWSDCDNALQNIASYDWIVFSSSNGVRYFLRRAQEQNIQRLPGRIAVVGKQTGNELEKFGYRADLIPDRYWARGLLDHFKNNALVSQKILIPTSDIGGDELIGGLKALGNMPEKIITYRTVCAESNESSRVMEQIQSGEIDVILFFSPSAVRCFLNLLGDSSVAILKKNQLILGVIGKTTARSLQENGLTVHILPLHSKQKSLVKAITHFLKDKVTESKPHV